MENIASRKTTVISLTNKDNEEIYRKYTVGQEASTNALYNMLTKSTNVKNPKN